jgi:hypothetical protein
MGSRSRTTVAILAALVAEGTILPNHKGVEFYYRALAPKASAKKKARRKQRQKSKRRNRR